MYDIPEKDQTLVNEFKKSDYYCPRCGQQIQAGAEVYAFNLAKSLAEQGMAVEVLTSQRMTTFIGIII